MSDHHLKLFATKRLALRKWLVSAAGLLFGTAAAYAPVSAAAAGLDINKASSNFALLSLNEAELAARKIDTIQMGSVELTSGRIVAADPLVQPERPAFTRTVPPGHYPVTLYQAFGRIAAASMRFADGTPVRWEFATIPGQDMATLKDDEFFGYPVDAGLGSYMDADTLALIDERSAKTQAENPASDINYYDDVLALELGGDGDFVLHQPVKGKPGNVAVFSSGWGDGFYPVFWGLSADGRPLVMLTDFQIIADADGRKEPGEE